MKSVYSRQFAMVAGLILASFVLLGISFAALSYRYTLEEQRDTLKENVEFIAEFTATYRTQGKDIREPGFGAYVYSLAKISKAHVVLCQPDGEIVYSADGQGQQELVDLVNQKVDQSLVNSVLRQGSYDGGVGTLGGLYREKRYVVGAPIIIHSGAINTSIGVAFASAPADKLTEMWRSLSGIFVFTAITVGILAFVFTSMTSRWQTKPLKEMAQAVRRFGHGEFEVRIPEDGRTDEIGELTHAFNAMADSLAQSEARRSEFVANISHELKTPMTTIAGFADGILDGTIPPEREAAALETISAETRRLSRLVRRMLDISRLQATGEVTAQGQFDAVEIMARSLVSLEGKINAKKLDVNAHFPEEPVKVWGDPDAITQVCYNLLDNAIKFSREGGHLWVSVEPKGAKALVSVRDEGETIPPQELPLIFDRFHKSDKSRSMDREGVGLGLYIVKTILNEHKENITVESADGVTQFQFTLTLV